MLDKDTVNTLLTSAYSNLSKTYSGYNTQVSIPSVIAKLQNPTENKIDLFKWDFNSDDISSTDNHKAAIIKNAHIRIQLIYTFLQDKKITFVTAFFLLNTILELALIHNNHLQNKKSNAIINIVKTYSNMTSALEQTLLNLLAEYQENLNTNLDSLKPISLPQTQTKKNHLKSESANERKKISTEGIKFTDYIRKLSEQFVEEEDAKSAFAANTGGNIYRILIENSPSGKKKSQSTGHSVSSSEQAPSPSSKEEKNKTETSQSLTTEFFGKVLKEVTSVAANFSNLKESKDQIVRKTKIESKKIFTLLEDKKITSTDLYSFFRWNLARCQFELEQLNHSSGRGAESGAHDSNIQTAASIIEENLEKELSYRS